MAQWVKNPSAVKEIQETLVQSLSLEDALESEMATHFSTLPWKILQTEEPGGLQSMGPQTDTTEHMALIYKMRE